jgi:protein SCO1/2
MASVALCGLAPSASHAAYRPTVSDIDPEILRMDESEFLGKKLNPKTVFIDDRGREFTLGTLRGKSHIMVLAYFTCDGACPAFNAELVELLKKVSALDRVKPGDDYRVITISFDANDNAMSAMHFRKMMELPEELNKNWVFATFKNPDEIKLFTSAIGYKFFWSNQDRMFYHPSAFLFLSPEGRIVRVVHNSNVEPKDMELAIIDTIFNKLRPSQVLTMAISLCYSYNYEEGKYGINYPVFIAFGSLFTGIGALAYGALRVKKRGKGKEMTI